VLKSDESRRERYVYFKESMTTALQLSWALGRPSRTLTNIDPEMRLMQGPVGDRSRWLRTINGMDLGAGGSTWFVEVQMLVFDYTSKA
jgi:hypothetical protein